MKNYGKAAVKTIKPGYKNVAWVAPLSYFTTLAAPLDAATEEARFIIEDDHVMAASKGFHKVMLVMNKNTMTGESKGDPGASWLDFTVSIVVPGDGAQAQSLVTDLLNEEFIVLVKDADCSIEQVVQLGCDCNPCTATGKFDGGMTAGDGGKAWTIEAKTNCRFFYTGTISESTT